VRSIYRFEGKVHDDSEVLLIVKTRADRCEELATRIRVLHPYSVPEVLALAAAGGSEPYLAWVAAESSR
jgi:periplasmic divalent cation tolerance protein